MKKILVNIAAIVFTVCGLISLFGCNMVDEEKPNLNQEYSILLLKDDVGVESVKLLSVDKDADKKTAKFSQEVAVDVLFKEGYKLAYFYSPKDVDIQERDGHYHFVMPSSNCVIQVKSQKNEENIVKKQYRFELIVINGGSPNLYAVNDYYDKGDKIPFIGFRPNSEDYGDLKWSSSDGEKYDYENLIMPDHDLTLTATYEKKK